MAITDLPFFSALKGKMRWHQAQQAVLADNVANADTPGYRGRDVRPMEFGKALAGGRAATAPLPVSAAVTASGHIAGSPMSARPDFATDKAEIFEITPRGNAVVLEEEMMRVAANQMDFQAVSTLYSRGLGIIRTALGRSA